MREQLCLRGKRPKWQATSSLWHFRPEHPTVQPEPRSHMGQWDRVLASSGTSASLCPEEGASVLGQNQCSAACLPPVLCGLHI